MALGGGPFDPAEWVRSILPTFNRAEGIEAMIDENTFQKKLAELVAEIGTLPAAEREKLASLAEQTQKRHKELRKTVGSLQESIDFLRLSIKYLVFDLEATRRENHYLRKMLEDNADS